MNLALLDAHIAAWDRGDTAEARAHAVKLRAYRDTIAPPEPVETVAERPKGWRGVVAFLRGLLPETDRKVGATPVGGEVPGGAS